jgi:predicted phage terminase large subunit-like protein
VTPEQIALERVRPKLAITDLAVFVRHFWSVVEPQTVLLWSPYLDAFCDHLQALAEGRHPSRHLLINMPPRHLKTLILSVFFPAWVWVRWPHKRFLCTSYDIGLSVEAGVKARRLLEHGKYRAILKLAGISWEFQGDQNVKSYYENTAGGSRVAHSVGSKGPTGKGADYLIADDLHPTRFGEGQLQEAIEYWDQAFANRVNDPKKAIRIVNGQRVAKGDISDHLLEKEPGTWDHLCFPFLYEEPDENNPAWPPTMLGYVDPRTVEGEVLEPRRWGPKEIQAEQRRGSIYFATQWQQRPSVKGGVIFKESDFKWWKVAPRFEAAAIHCDLATKGSPAQQLEAIKNRSFVVFQLWGYLGPDSYLIDEERGQWDFERTCQRFVDATKRWGRIFPNAKKVIEAKANGPALVSRLRSQIPGLEEWEPNGSKVERAYACQGRVESGNVYLPQDAPWIREWVAEVSGFPNARHNDRVDAFTQAQQWRYGGAQGVLSMYKAILSR